MNKMLKLTGLALLCGGIIASTSTLAHMEKDRPSGRSNCDKYQTSSQGEQRGFGKMKHALQDLDLSEAQQSKLKIIIADAKSTMKSMRETMQSRREKLRSLMHNSVYDADAVNRRMRFAEKTIPGVHSFGRRPRRVFA